MSKQREALAGAMAGGSDRRARAGERAGGAPSEDLHMATLRVPVSLWRTFKAQAATEGTSVQALGQEAMELLLAQRSHDDMTA